MSALDWDCLDRDRNGAQDEDGGMAAVCGGIGHCYRLVASASLAAGEKRPSPLIPGAVDFGTETPAGRHLPVPQTTVIKVTNLNDSGPGSLREALAVKGPRVVVFEVSGCVDIEKVLLLGDPYVTVADQTAPWPGIVAAGGLEVWSPLKRLPSQFGECLAGGGMPIGFAR